MSFFDRTKVYFSRVVRNEANKRGIAAAGAGFVMALIIEAAWPTPPGS
jgi:hypothetical protein